jgi:hypothetical protein
MRSERSVLAQVEQFDKASDPKGVLRDRTNVQNYVVESE